jgi:ornithine cyclodeaminase
MANLAGQGCSDIVLQQHRRGGAGADIVTTVTADKARHHHHARDDRARHAPQCRRRRLPGQDRAAPRRARGGAVFVEFEPQTRIEGDIQQMPADFPVTEFWQVLAGRPGPHELAAQVTVFDSVGFALEDYSALSFLLRARRTELGLIGDSRSTWCRRTATRRTCSACWAAIPCPTPMHIVHSA